MVLKQYKSVKYNYQYMLIGHHHSYSYMLHLLYNLDNKYICRKKSSTEFYLSANIYRPHIPKL